LGHAFICASAIFLFFPASIGSTIWVSGHLIRPFGFIILFFSLNHEELISLRGSILYRTLAAFSLLASIPLFMFGMVISYDNITPVPLFSRKIIVFLLLLVTLSSALIFSLGLIIRLIHPILFLKNSVDRLIDEGFNQRIQVKNFDEIGELSQAFNDMVIKLRESTLERDRLSRFAATGELAATLAHEIKNPLNAIAGAAKYLEKNFHTPLIKEFAKIIFDEVMRINALTQNLLDFAKPIHAELKQADLNELVLETIRLLGQEFKDQNTSIETELAENIPIIKFDYNHIKQLLINLIINSLDAIKEEGRIKIMTVSQNGKIFLSVEDNGQGIPQKDLEKIFNPFFTTKTRGSGLGLAISQKIAKEHGGDLFVSLNQKERTKISLVLPI
jgi:signal transduction histidine kinase